MAHSTPIPDFSSSSSNQDSGTLSGQTSSSDPTISTDSEPNVGCVVITPDAFECESKGSSTDSDSDKFEEDEKSDYSLDNHVTVRTVTKSSRHLSDTSSDRKPRAKKKGMVDCKQIFAVPIGSTK